MQTLQTMILVVLVSFFMSCSEHQEEHKTTLNTESNFDDVLRDDNGNPWEVQFSTDSLVRVMQDKVSSFEDGSSLDEYAALKGDLNEDFSEIFNRCNMTGEAHNQLHNYLIPLRNEIRKINDTINDSNPSQIHEIRSYLSEFERYFKLNLDE